MEDLTLPLDALVRSVGLNPSKPLAIFLGAGASISSGMPSAQMCIWEWKRDIFLTNHPGLEKQFSELSLASTRKRIQSWLDSQGRFPHDGSSDEYSSYIQECFPIIEDRREYFQEKVRTARPHIGYQLLCHLAQADLIRSVWSTNFDSLTARAAAPLDLAPREVGIDAQQRLAHTAAKGELLCVSLHGDYRYDQLKNTSEELRAQEKELEEALVKQVRDASMIVSGYSGQDESVMQALRTAYSGQGEGTLFWCGYGDEDPPERVASLIRYARSEGRQAYYVSTIGFDDLMTRLALHCLQDEKRAAVERCIIALTPKGLLHREPFDIPAAPTGTVIKSNAFEIQCPSETLQFDLKSWPSTGVWEWLRQTTTDHSLTAVPLRGKVLALGTIEDIQSAFADNIKGAIERVPVSEQDLSFEDGAVISLMRRALVRSMVESWGLETDGREMLWNPSKPKRVRHAGAEFIVHEAVVLHLRRLGKKQYLVLKPTLKVLDHAGAEPPLETSNLIKLDLLGSQYNKRFNEAMNTWRATLFPKTQIAEYSFPRDSEPKFKFQIRRSPIFASIGVSGRREAIKVPEMLRPLIRHQGLQLPEPELLFSNKTASATTRDTHPIRGMIRNRPFDYPVTSRGLSTSVRVGVICPAPETQLLDRYLRSIHHSTAPRSSEKDYLLEYPGFHLAYGLPIELPTPGSNGWISCAEPSAHDSVSGSVEVARLINRDVDRLQASHAPDVVLVFIPDRWQSFHGFNTEYESFDLHNFVKAYCVQRGIASQFLNQGTLTKEHQCGIWWWLSLAMYVKSLRTPWLLENLADDTAFVGLGFSLDRNAQSGDQVVLGCSHIYSAQGEGLQYRLSKIENPIMRRGNPFMSLDDARRVGETIRELFFRSRMKLPERVVLHKRTPFLKPEREGLRDGLSGVESVDMLEVQIDHALRYVASKQGRDGNFTEDNYPVRRGTVMKLDDWSALLWVHGATEALNPRMNYFQGKRRIPAPLIVRRNAGKTSLQQLSAEILGLSKMNWNTFNLYTKLPATLSSSVEIARIGSLLERFGASSYDYRLFI